MHVKGRFTLRLMRRFAAAPTKVRAGVRVERRTLPGPVGGTVLVHEPAGRRRPSGALLWMSGGG